MVEDTRQKLIEAAGMEFAEHGFEATTVRAICTRAGANLAAVNYHFRDKLGLYIEAVRQAHCQQGQELPEFGWPEGTPASSKLRDFIRHMLSLMLDREQPAWHVELVMREMARPTAACEQLVRDYIGPMFAQLLALIDELAECPLSARQRTLLGFSVVAQCLLYRYHRPVGRLLIGEDEYQALFDVELLAEQITTFSVGGIRSVAAGHAASPTTPEVRR